MLLILLSQTNVIAKTWNIKNDFGAKGNGRTNDFDAFEKACAVISKDGGNAKLIIPEGTYIIGKQKKHDKLYLMGLSTLKITNANNVEIVGIGKAILKYEDKLKFGTFDRVSDTALKVKGRFTKIANVAHLDACIKLINCKNIKISNLELDGNSTNLEYGGNYGDKGIQLSHFGLWLSNSTYVELENLFVHHFQDGLYIRNNIDGKNLKNLDSIEVKNCKFFYNSRQGMSIIGGNGLNFYNCSFSFTGQKVRAFAPTAGVDIEPDKNMARNIRFTKCDFIDNKGVGFLVNVGDTKYVSLDSCLFWGCDAWSTWVQQPNISFKNSTFHGSTVWGYDAEGGVGKTQFINCLFEDKDYNGKSSFGRFLVESNYSGGQEFNGCKFISHEKGIIWIDGRPQWIGNISKYQKFTNCKFQVEGFTGKRLGLIRTAVLKNCTFSYSKNVAEKIKFQHTVRE